MCVCGGDTCVVAGQLCGAALCAVWGRRVVAVGPDGPAVDAARRRQTRTSACGY